jgi:hypothetical protein
VSPGGGLKPQGSSLLLLFGGATHRTSYTIKTLYTSSLLLLKNKAFTKQRTHKAQGKKR